ncbi:uncharacterized protein with HEPN domain/predicted nucleotidyltransferase [Methanocalculus alkaliphilus]|uniref:HepT-like ribonuclease domain-containing protein n=1 Tax=Methanocalculus alkaliphilus TaxID=768730 RepID=UPI0020A22755|nr:HepT-like ribonuclease domain-containing protein [Methanocalculus alkaliphilus]MCP1714924.1 uncharacterized protein with HEPN domain/predicted nucleotidyltransferase [Methanocalculus alkaliphilus]
MRSRQEITSILTRQKDEMTEMFGVTKLGTFGPKIQGDGEVSVIVALSDDRDLLDMAGLSTYIREKTGQHVPVISINGVPDELRPLLFGGEGAEGDHSRFFLKEIASSFSDIETFCQGMQYQDFLQDRRAQAGVLGKLSAIGLLSRGISVEMKAAHPSIPWHALSGLPEVVTSWYGTDLQLVWAMVRKKVPGIRRSLGAQAGAGKTEKTGLRRFF